MGTSRPIVPFLVILCHFTLGCQAHPAKGKDEPKPESFRENEPDFIMKVVNVQYYGPSGLEWELKAPRMMGHSSKNLTQAQNLNVTMFDNGAKSSYVTASNGMINTASPSGSGSEKPLYDPLGVELKAGDMFLSGEVVVVSTDGTKILSDWLRYSQNADLITSTAPVTIIRSDSTTRGRGLEAKPDFSFLKVFDETLVINDAETNERSN